jgi:HYR domain
MAQSSGMTPEPGRESEADLAVCRHSPQRQLGHGFDCSSPRTRCPSECAPLRRPCRCRETPSPPAPAACPSGGYQISAYPAQLDVRGRGTISLSVAASSQCAPAPTDILNVSQAFQIVGGTGVFAGASGSGVVSRTDTGYTDHGVGTDHWDGTITAPAWDAIDLTPPTIRGAANKLVRAPRNARRVRVRYRVTATDVTDGTVSVRCKPASGSRFKVGRSTRVRCAAGDLSANIAHAASRVTVRHR